MASKPRKVYIVTYGDHHTVQLNLIPENVALAMQGDDGMQASIIWQYFKALGYTRPPNWHWNYVKLRQTGQVGRPPRHSSTAQTRATSSQTVEKYGCTCDDCAACNQGWHASCKNCRMGEPVDYSKP